MQLKSYYVLDVDSGISLNLRSAARLGGRSRQLTPLVKEPVAVVFSETMIVGEDNDNHSSEEELEDIIGSARKKVYVNGTVPTAAKAAPGRMSAVEKRKWSEVEQGGRAGSGSSADEEVSLRVFSLILYSRLIQYLTSRTRLSKRNV